MHVRICLLAWLISLTLAGVAPGQTRPATEPATRPPVSLTARAERVARELPWMDTGFVRDGEPRWGPDAARCRALWQTLRDPADVPRALPTDENLTRLMAFRPGPWSADEIRPLLRHADPKVRTLGIALLFQLNRADALADLAPLAFDDAATFPYYIGVALIRPGEPMQSGPPQGQAVRDFARAAIGEWARASPLLAEVMNYQPPKDADAMRRALDQFAAARPSPLNVAAMRIAMGRASGGRTSIDDAHRERVRWVFRLLEEIEMPRRFFVAVSREFTDRAEGGLGDDFHLLALARQVPRADRLAAFKNRRPRGDFDLPDPTPFLTRHCVELFRASDADLFLKLGGKTRERLAGESIVNYVEGVYPVIAARLRPADADAILAAAMDRAAGADAESQRARLAIATAMAEVGGEKSLARAVDWFYDGPPDKAVEPQARERLLCEVNAADPMRAKRLVEHLARDPRLGHLDAGPAGLVVEMAEGYLGRRLKGVGELRRTVDEWSR